MTIVFNVVVEATHMCPLLMHILFAFSVIPQIVAVTLFDQFHEVQKKACSLLVAMANRDPEVFGNKTGVFLKGLVPCLNHAHSRVKLNAHLFAVKYAWNYFEL